MTLIFESKIGRRGLESDRFERFFSRSLHSRRNLGVLRPEEPARQHQISKGEQREQLRVVLGETTVACLAMLEQAPIPMGGKSDLLDQTTS